ncbi:MAG: biotin--[acetyl-CoA-carboxylase] ligase [Desulfobulbus sp.]|nr:MAG: biotin--[acetyl-CoA-carboxylase] ligase [Desulfobulbus sp.]
MCRLQELILEAEDRGETLAAGTVVVADSLNRSTGRFDRRWHAPAGGAWLAIVWPDILLPEFTRLLPFAVGLAGCRTLNSYRLDARLKWVNDILLGPHKIGGILCQTFLSSRGERFHLLGIGINVNNMVFPAELDQASVSLAGALGSPVDLEEFIARFLAELTLALGLLHHDEAQYMHSLQDEVEKRPGILLDTWKHLCDSVGKQVEFGYDVQKKPLYRARVTGYDHSGGLVMELPDGRRTVEVSGEIRYL